MPIGDFGLGLFSPIVWVIIIWSVIWKGWALWRAARNNHLTWYVVLLVVNLVGLLEIIYIFFFSGYGKTTAAAKPAAKPKASKKKK